MTIQEILEFIMLPVLGWLLMNSSRNARKLSRIEVCVKLLMRKYKISLDDSDDD